MTAGATDRATGLSGQNNVKWLYWPRAISVGFTKDRTIASDLTGLRSMVSGSTSLERKLLILVELEPQPVVLPV